MATIALDPLIGLASDLSSGSTIELADLAASLKATLRQTIRRNGGRAFGACHTCRHFARGEPASSAMPHRCKLLKEPLSEADSQSLCVEQEDRLELAI